ADKYRVVPQPAGLAYANGTFQWRPAATDTGYVYLNLIGTGTCPDKEYLALKVSPKRGTAIRPRAAGAKAPGAGATLLAAGPASFRIRLAQVSTLEVT